MTDASPLRLPARVFEPSLRPSVQLYFSPTSPVTRVMDSGAARSTRKLPLVLSRRSSSTAVARDDLTPTATHFTVARAMSCADELSVAVSCFRSSSLDVSDPQLPADQTMSSTCGLGRSPARSTALPRTTQIVPHPVPLRFSRPHSPVSQKMSPLGDKLTRNYSRMNRCGGGVLTRLPM